VAEFSLGGDKASPAVGQGKNAKHPRVRLGDIVDRFGGTTFVQTSMMGVGEAGGHGEVSVVSFRPVESGAQWTHVVANNMLTESEGSVSAAVSRFKAQTSQFQYAALVDTPVRATVYREFDEAAGRTRLVAAVSTDTGKTFKHHLSFGKEQLGKLGINDFDETTVFAASQCLFEDRDGQVYVDIIVSNGGSMHYARVPIGVNAADLRKKLASFSSEVKSGAVVK
tara:strand:- start:2873 stop:3544 length:672 start_codon:yes stop_codon:yes gene_type:complete